MTHRDRDQQQAAEGLRDALRVHHPIMRSETGPFSGCRCGQVRIGQDVIAHVVEQLADATVAEEAQCRAKIEALVVEYQRLPGDMTIFVADAARLLRAVLDGG